MTATATCPNGCWEVSLPKTATEAMVQMMTCPDCETRLEATEDGR